MRMRLLMAVMALSLLFVAPADAQTELDRARTKVANATERLESLLADLDETQSRGDALAGNYWQVQSGLEKLDLDVQASELVAADLQVQSDGLRLEVKVIAVDQYMSRSSDFGIGDHESEADRAAAEALARLVVGADNNAIDQLAVINESQAEVRVQLDTQRAQQIERLAQVEATQANIVQELDRLARLQSAVVAELADLDGALADLEAAEAERQAVAAEAAAIAQERERAQAAAAAAAARARQVPTPAPPAPTATPVPQPTAVPAVEPLPTGIPNPQPSEPLATAVPNPQPSGPQPSEPLATSVPNPQPSGPLPSEPLATAVPNPQPSGPLPSEPLATSVPNPQPSEPLPIAEPVAPVVAAAGGIVCPLAGPFTHTDDFNAPRQVGGVHRANDLISAQGTPVIAASAGTVEHRDSSVGGLSAHLKGDNGDYYFYTHLSGYENVGAGHVAAGTVIGYVGMTGNAPIPHLHFEIHKGGYGNYSNPYGPVRAACF